MVQEQVKVQVQSILQFWLVLGSSCGDLRGRVWYTGAGCMVGCVGGGGYKRLRFRFRVAIENGSILHFWFVLGFRLCSAHCRWFWGGVVQEQVEVQVQGGGRERFQRCGMLPCAGPAARAYVGAGRGT